MRGVTFIYISTVYFFIFASFATEKSSPANRPLATRPFNHALLSLMDAIAPPTAPVRPPRPGSSALRLALPEACIKISSGGDPVYARETPALLSLFPGLLLRGGHNLPVFPGRRALQPGRVRQHGPLPAARPLLRRIITEAC